MNGDLANSLNFLEEDVERRMGRIRRELLGRDVTILDGKFEGRRGRITEARLDVTIRDRESRHGVLILVQPYRLRGEGEKLLWDGQLGYRHWSKYRLEKR